ncbi:nuclear pore complex protein Nup50-like [Acanthaster planci]|uniref:Nuclear pore complex protein Nup50-like n=1 Tax=Acanthaster planci TaxID=133434 RepID=A0A8B7XRM0_ACAPL|nr:nuclear pore complex protein Nup50-like [Acanthaster planci]XP_022082627.1 nuclear pore complex protein Nup50-like [Acanthaster planci]
MAKRRAGTELTDRNWEEEEVPEEAGTFKAAGDDVLAQRVIRKAKRRFQAGEGNDAGQDSDTKPSPFVGFAFGTNKPSAGFSFKVTKSDTQTAPSFSFKSSVSDVAPALAKADTIPISSGPSSSISSSFGGTKQSASPASTNGTQGVATGGAPQPPPTTALSQQYSQKLQNLNRSVSAWIQKHVGENPVCDLTPVFEDYKKHLREIEKLRAGNVGVAGSQRMETSSEVEASAPSTSSTFSFGKSSDTVQDAKVSDSMKASPATSTFSFGSSDGKGAFGKSSDADQFAKATDSSKAAPTTSTFSFGSSDSKGASLPKADFFKKTAPAATTDAKTSSFSFGRSDTTPVAPSFSAGKFGNPTTGSLFGSAKPFSFGVGKSSDVTTSSEAATTASEDSKTANDDNYEPPKVEVKAVQEKDSLYSKKCKLFYKKGDGYKDRGVGMLHLKKTADSLQLLVRADTNLGNVILNITVPATLPISRQGKNNLLLVTPVNPPVETTCPKCNKKYPRPQDSNACDNGCSPDPMALLVRVKTGQDADEALEKINELRGV